MANGRKANGKWVDRWREGVGTASARLIVAATATRFGANASVVNSSAAWWRSSAT